MPIKGLSDRNSVDPRFKEIGRLRKGAAKKGNRPGEDLEWFRFVPDGNRADVLQAFKAAYGDQPVRLEVYLPFDAMERNFSSWREAYGKNRLCKLRCDGECWHDWVMEDRHYHSQDGRECDFEFRDSENGCPKCPCAHVGRLSVILPELWYAGHVGLVTVLTSSKNDIAEIASKLAMYEPLTGKPFMLWRENERIGVPIQGKRAGVDKSLIHIELTEERLLLEFNAARERSRAQLMAPQPERTEQEQPDDSFPDDDELINVEPLPFDQEPDYTGSEMDEGAYADYREIQEDEAAEIDSLEGEAEQDDASAAPSWLTPPEENNWTEFFTRCVDELGYDHPAHASTVKDQAWLKDPRPTWDELWTHMIEHQAEKGHLYQG